MPYVEASVRSRQFVAAAREVMLRDGVTATTLRAVAAEADVPLGTLQYVFSSKEALLRAVIEDVVEEISTVLTGTVELDRGLAHAIRQGLTSFWSELVADHVKLQLMQGELLHYALRKPGQESMASWQYRRYVAVLTGWCRGAAVDAGEKCALPYDRLARVMLAGVDGLIAQYVCEPDEERARADLDTMIAMLIASADIRPV
ncbi:TetR family transcriptional regulator [Amycolatopsis sp. WAC 01375]|uniref:TetR/AcrR family transcriptional regulator n=1 Tax=unclassified Amycolatopsis TaxID=2618356 RepID=UPI000F787A42|nr:MULTISPECIES: TetR/AcrR family transcriptional regulator [unclassified Amycolatopsis]RSM76574.1 TetR family transcriptional regulator [Amycolatopsis sp. WAC 01375]RSN33203.1 TetR family transcriptional regulator [Amycolatopsis sp. WAC 01416]